MTSEYDAILVVSFGGPEKREDVIPFLENVLRGKPVPVPACWKSPSITITLAGRVPSMTRFAP
jgi:protoheme ferro-lyase